MPQDQEPAILSSTPIKDQVKPIATQMSDFNGSVDDLLLAIDKNISSTSLNFEHESPDLSASFNTSDEPIKPLNVKPLVATHTTETEDSPKHTETESVMEDIPRAPSFDELEFNTRLNRESSISRLSGPRQLANSTLSRSFSNNLGRSSSFRSSAPTTRENSPSKKSVCFESSPPKIVEYEELTPDNSDNSVGSEHVDEAIGSNWGGKLKSTDHPLPPPPPKHQVLSPSPQKDTSLGSSDDDTHDYNLTKEDLKNHSITLEEKLDLVLGSDSISKRVQEDETNRGSGSPFKSLTKEEEELLLNIKSRDMMAEEDYLRDASEMFEQDLRNNEKNARVLRLDPVLRRRNSNNSLKDEERELTTQTVSVTMAPIVLEDGLKNADIENLPSNGEIVNISQSTLDSFASATDIYESEPISHPIKKEPQSSNSISTLQGDEEKSHKKKLSISESINSFISSFGKSNKKTDDETGEDAVHSKTVVTIEPYAVTKEQGEVEEEKKAEAEAEPAGLLPAGDIEQLTTNEVDVSSSIESAPVLETADQDPLLDRVSINTSAHEEESDHDDTQAPIEHQSLLIYSSPILQAESSDFVQEELLHPSILDDIDNESELSFANEFKETVLYNSSDCMNEDYRSMPDENIQLPERILEQADQEKECIVVQDVEHEVEETPIIDAARSHVPKPVDTTIPQYELVSPILKSPLAKPIVNRELANDYPYASAAVQTDPVEVEIAVQTDEFVTKPENDEEMMKSLLQSSPDFDDEVEIQRPTGTIPSFNSTLFHDKVPDDTITLLTPPTSYIDIWHNIPKPDSPKPQYGIGNFGSRITPPENLMRTLSTRRSKGNKPEKITLGSTKQKREEDTERRRLSLLKEDSLVATSVSPPSVMKVGSRNISLSFETSFVDNSIALANSSEIDLPDVSTFSDFAGAFDDWNISQSKDIFDRSLRLNQMKKDMNRADEIREIWGTNLVKQEENSRSPSIDTGKIENMIATVDTNGEIPHVKSSNVIGEVVVTKQEDLGVAVEYEQDSQTNISEAKPLVSLVPPHILETATPTQHYSPKSRILSTGSGFDLGEEFEKAVKQHVPSAPADILNDTELAKPMVPEPDNLNYMKTRAKKDAFAVSSARKPQGPRVRTPLSSLVNNDLNQIMDTRKSSIYSQRIASKPLSENYQVGSDAILHKRDSCMSMYQSTEGTMPDKGRLYIHVNSISDVVLDQIKDHKAYFRLYLDNGKHTIATPKVEFGNHVDVDKEFEVAVDEDLTNLYFTLKVAYQRPENELVEVYDKVPIENNRLSRLIGMKPKYRVQKSWVSRKKEKDDWDNKFANDGSFCKNKINFFAKDNEITWKSQNYVIELFNEWETQEQAGKVYKKAPHLVAKMDVKMLYIPRTSHLETLPPSIQIAETVAGHIAEQSNVRFEGYLFQEGGDCDLWKRRYFKVEGTKLIAHHEVTKKPRALINLFKVSEVLHNGKKKVDGQRNFTDEILMNEGFKLKFKNGEIITFNAETKELKDEWIDIFEKVVGLNRFHQPWVKSLARSMLSSSTH